MKKILLALTAPFLMSTAFSQEIESPVTLAEISKPFPDPADLAAKSAFPDPLVTMLGAPVSTRESWEKERAPELRRLFQYYMYGQMPLKPAAFDAKVIREDKTALGGKATLREIAIRWDVPALNAHLLLLVPNKRTGPAPVFLGINFNGNHALLADPLIQLPQSWMPSGRLGVGEDHKASEAGRGKETDAWAIEKTIDRGYAFACFYHGDIVPDNAELARERLRGFQSPLKQKDDPKLGGDADNAKLKKTFELFEAKNLPNATATIAAWAWGFSRMIDYLVTDTDIDAKRIAIVGHSRNGKTALLAAAMDERVAMVIPTQAGCGGTAPNRLPAELQNPPDGKLVHETVKRINTSFPHWFCENFKAFNDATDKLPFDQHCLIALCAPRAVLLSNATEDQWANPAGQFAMARAADPVFQLLAGDGLGAEKMPEVGTLLASRLGYYIRPGKHSMTGEDWKVWLDYADKWLKPARAAAACCDPFEPGGAPRSRTARLTQPK